MGWRVSGLSIGKKWMLLCGMVDCGVVCKLMSGPRLSELRISVLLTVNMYSNTKADVGIQGTIVWWRKDGEGGPKLASPTNLTS